MSKRAATLKVGVQLTIPATDVWFAPLPHAAKTQLDVTDWDHALVAIALRSNWRVFWWWGTRRIENQTGAWCYVCQSWIVNYSRAWPVPIHAQQEIDSHRASHYELAQAEIEGK